MAPLFLNFPEKDECKTMDSNFPGFVSTVGNEAKVFLCKSDSVFGKCLHQAYNNKKEHSQNTSNIIVTDKFHKKT